MVSFTNSVNYLLFLLKTFFLFRTDFIAFAPPWASAVCPAKVLEEYPLEMVLGAHLLGDKAPEVRLEWHSTSKGKCGTTRPGHWRIGSYQVAGTTIRWLCIDLDGPTHKTPLADPLAAALLIRARLKARGIDTYLEKSGSGSGYHIWGFFAEPVDASKVRVVVRSCIPSNIPLANGGFADPDAIDNSTNDREQKNVIEIFPKQAKHRKGGFGNMVWLPWWYDAKASGNQFYEPDKGALVSYLPETFETIPVSIIEECYKDLESKNGSRDNTGAKSRKPKGAPISVDSEIAKTEDALSRLSLWRRDTYDPWLRVGMALRGLGTVGLALWDQWSRGSDKYQTGICEEKWKSFTPDDGLTIASLFHWADQDDPGGAHKHTSPKRIAPRIRSFSLAPLHRPVKTTKFPSPSRPVHTERLILPERPALTTKLQEEVQDEI